jgi:ketosteroid isomerase-like protein
MSEENVELVGATLADVPALSRLAAVVGEDFVWDLTTFEGWPEQEEYRGFEAFVGFMLKWVDPYEEWQLEAEEILDAGGDKVVALLHQQGRLRDSESYVELRYGIVYTVQGGRLLRAQVYATPDEALDAVGLRPPRRA